MASTAVGEVLREWRTRRRRSQMDLALDVGVSTRHLSFIETGRSRPSAQVLLALADGLDMPLRERNALLLAAGHAPRYGQTDLADEDMAPVLAAVRALLDAHGPFPGVAVDRRWNVVAANADATLLAGLPPSMASGPGSDPAGGRPASSGAPGGQPVNVYRLSLHPDGMAPRIRNFGQWAAHLLDQLRRDVRATGDDELRALYEEVAAYPNVLEAVSSEWPDGGGERRAEAPEPGVLLPLQLDSPIGPLSLFTTLTTFGTPRDVTVQELVIELFFPADETTRALLTGSTGDTATAVDGGPRAG